MRAPIAPHPHQHSSKTSLSFFPHFIHRPSSLQANIRQVSAVYKAQRQAWGLLTLCFPLWPHLAPPGELQKLWGARSFISEPWARPGLSRACVEQGQTFSVGNLKELCCQWLLLPDPPLFPLNAAPRTLILIKPRHRVVHSQSRFMFLKYDLYLLIWPSGKHRAPLWNIPVENLNQNLIKTLYLTSSLQEM